MKPVFARSRPMVTGAGWAAAKPTRDTSTVAITSVHDIFASPPDRVGSLGQEPELVVLGPRRDQIELRRRIAVARRILSFAKPRSPIVGLLTSVESERA